MAGEASEAKQAEDLWNEVAKQRSDEAAGAPLTAAKPGTPDADDAATQDEGEQSPAAEGSAKQAEPDPYEGLSPALKARLQKFETYETQVAQLPQLTQAVKTAEGRVAAMQRELDVSKAAKAGPGPSQTQIAAASGSLEKWDTLKSDFPEWADATEQFVRASLAGLKPSEGFDPAKVDQLIEQRVAAVRADAIRMVELAKVETKHPDWIEDRNSEDFAKWEAAQAPEVKALALSEKARDAIRMLDLFYEAKAKPAQAVQQERNARLAAAASSKPSGGSASTGKTVEEMNPAELWEYERKRAAKRGGERGLNY